MSPLLIIVSGGIIVIINIHSGAIPIICNVITGLQENSDSLPRKQLGRQELFGCLRGQITMAEDFNAPLSDFVGYIE
jgi:hypothetical protein